MDRALLARCAAVAVMAVSARADVVAAQQQAPREGRFSVVPRLAVAAPLGGAELQDDAAPGVAVAVEMAWPNASWGAYMDGLFTTDGNAITAGVALRRPGSVSALLERDRAPAFGAIWYTGVGVGVRDGLGATSLAAHLRAGVMRRVTGVGLTGDVGLLVGTDRVDEPATVLVLSVGVAIPG